MALHYGPAIIPAATSVAGTVPLPTSVIVIPTALVETMIKTFGILDPRLVGTTGSPDVDILILVIENQTSVVGGEILGTDITSLFVAGTLANAGLIVPIVGATAAVLVGFALRKRTKAS